MKWQQLYQILVQLYHMGSDYTICAAIIPYDQRLYHMGSDYAQYNPYQIHYYTVRTVLKR